MSKWFPFRFKRRKREETSSNPGSAESSGTGTEAAMARRSDPFDFNPMMRMMSRMFSDDFWRSPTALSRDMDRFFGDFSPARFEPNVDIVDEGKTVRVSAEMPGLDKNDVHIDVHDGMLTIRGEKKQENEREEEGCYRTERYYGSFARNVPLPSDLDYQRAEADFDKGVLAVRFPKMESSGPRKRIVVQ